MGHRCVLSGSRSIGRDAAASFWAIQDPANVRGAKDLLGQATFGGHGSFRG
jgi:hypothetical protein